MEDKILEIMGLVDALSVECIAFGIGQMASSAEDKVTLGKGVKKARELLESKLSEFVRDPEKGSLRECAMCDLSYANGMLAGWNLCVSDDAEGFEKARSNLLRESVRVLRELHAHGIINTTKK